MKRREMYEKIVEEMNKWSEAEIRIDTHARNWSYAIIRGLYKIPERNILCSVNEYITYKKAKKILEYFATQGGKDE